MTDSNTWVFRGQVAFSLSLILDFYHIILGQMIYIYKEVEEMISLL